MKYDPELAALLAQPWSNNACRGYVIYATTVKKILTLQEYCGDVINFKTYSKSYKMKRRIENPEENRAIFLNVHEPIIDRVTWEKVQSLQTTRRRRPNPGSKSQGIKQLMAGGGIILLGTTLIPVLGTLF